MSDEDANAAEIRKLARELAPDLCANRHVECGEGLIEKQEPRLRDQRSQQRDALRLAARQLARQDTGLIAQSRPGERLAGDTRCIALEPERDVLQHRHVREQRVVLEDEPDAALLRRDMPPARRIVEDVTVQRYTSFYGEEARKGAEKRCLACAVGSEHRDRFLCVDRELDVEREAVPRDLDCCVEAHGQPSQRSRSEMRMTSDTARRMRLRTNAPSGLVSSAT